MRARSMSGARGDSRDWAWDWDRARDDGPHEPRNDALNEALYDRIQPILDFYLPRKAKGMTLEDQLDAEFLRRAGIAVPTALPCLTPADMTLGAAFPLIRPVPSARMARELRRREWKLRLAFALWALVGAGVWAGFILALAMVWGIL